MRIRGLLVLFSIGCFVVAAAAPAAPAQEDDKPRGSEGAGAKPAPSGQDKPAADKPAEGKDAEKSGEDEPKEKKDSGGGGLFGSGNFLFIMLGVFLLMYIVMGGSKRKQAAKRRDMLGALKKGDKINTIGGIIGTVIEVRDSDVTVKVDETNNIRVRFTRSAISRVGDEAKTDKPQDKK